MKFRISNKKKTIKAIGIIIFGILVIVGVILLLIRLSSSSISENNLKKKLENEGKKFYEKFYFNNEELKSLGEDEIKNFLKAYKDKGLKISLYTLSTYDREDDSFINQFVNPKTKKPCDQNETKVIIYPKEPFDSKSYKIEVELSCE